MSDDTAAPGSAAGVQLEHVFSANRAWWDERVPIHVGSRFYDIDGFKAGRDSLEPFEVAEMGDVSAADLVHLQCHFGLDTLSWARHGARVTGLDFSEPAIAAARRLADEIGVAAQFVCANVYDAPRVLGRDFDVVYVSHGAINWLPDIDAWASVVDELLRPGGRLYLSEFHPFVNVFGDDDLSVTYDYFHGTEPKRWDDGSGTYADLAAATTNNETFEMSWTLGEVVSALTTRRLHLEFLHEHGYTLFPRFPWLEQRDDGTYWLPQGTPSLPFIFSLRATKPQ